MEFDSMPASKREYVLGLLTIQASSLPKAMLSNASRVPLDLVAAIDKSGSMNGSKIELVKKTLQYMLTQLTPLDRFSIIRFDHSANVMDGLRMMNDSNKDRFNRLISKLEASGGTDIFLAVKLAFEVLTSRRTENRISSIMLLTDGQDSTSLDKIKTLDFPECISVHCYGFGADHDRSVMDGVAELAHGTFTYVESDDMLSDAFATCLGGLFSTVAQKITVELTTAEGCKINKLSTRFKFQIENGGHRAKIDIPDLFAEEKRDLLIEFEVEPTSSNGENPIPIASALFSFVRTNSLERDHSERGDPVDFLLKRMDDENASKTPNHLVDIHRNRMITVEAMERAVALGEDGDLKEARNILEHAMDTVKNSVSKDDALCKVLLDNLSTCILRFSDGGSFRQGGGSYASSSSRSHWQQRTTSSWYTTYSTTTQREQLSSVSDFMNP